MSYDLLVFFGGLCLATFDRDTGEPAVGKVFLVNTRNTAPRAADLTGVGAKPHFARLTVRRRHLIEIGAERNAKPNEIRPAPDGEDLALFYLDDKRVTIESPRDRQRIKVSRRAGPLPTTPDEVFASEDWYEWAVSLFTLHQDIRGLASGVEDPGPNGPTSALVEFQDGDFKTHRVGRGPKGALKFGYQSIEGTEYPRLGQRSITDRFLLKITNLDDPTKIKLGDKLFGVEAADGKTLHLSIVNMCFAVTKDDEVLVDFAWLYNLVGWQASPPPVLQLIVPFLTPDSILTPSTGTCPPAR